MKNTKNINWMKTAFIGLALILTILFGFDIPTQAASTGDVVINEIMQNPSAVLDSAGEWFELFNTTASDIDINGWTIADNGSDSHVINNGGPLIIPAGGYLVLGINGDYDINGGVNVDYVYGSTWFLSNTADEIILLDDSSPDPVEIDRVEYDGGPTFPDPAGASMALKNPVLDNNIGTNWCTSTTPFGDGDLGTPGAINDCVVNVMPGDIIINEIMQNPSAVLDSAGEWFELFNTTASDIDINGWTIADLGADSHVINNGGPLVIPAGGYLVLGNNGDTSSNGGVNVNYVYSNWYLSNSADEIILFDDSPDPVEIDHVEYDGGPTFPDPNGASMALKDPALDNNIGTNWCTSTTPFGDGDLGTPGVANNCVVSCEGDFDTDGDVDGSDLATFAADFGRTNCSSEPPCEGDFDTDGDVDGSDLATFAADFGRTDCIE